MTDHFEVRHRALREAEEAVRTPAPKYSVAHGHALLALDRFEKHTRSLVDDALAAAREMLKCGEHEGECDGEPGEGCARHRAAFELRKATLTDQLAALDEEANRG